MKLNEKLIILREKNNFSQEEIAKYLGVGQTTYSRYENLKTIPDIFIIKKLAILYNISIDSLLNEVENENISITLTNEEIEVLQNINNKINNNKIINQNINSNNTTKNSHITIGNNNNINDSFK